MAKNYKIGVVGNRDAIQPFKAVCFSSFPVNHADEVAFTLKQMEQENYGIIYLMEDFAQEIPDLLRAYDARVTPALILIPTHKGRLGIGSQRIQENVEKAVGADILSSPREDS